MSFKVVTINSFLNIATKVKMLTDRQMDRQIDFINT